MYYQYTTAPKHLQYGAIRMMLKRLFAHAGITKRIYPHLFRHSRATLLVATGVFTEAQAKAHFGWAPDSRMLGIYTHLIHDDANQALLAAHNLKTSTATQPLATPIICFRCKAHNPPRAVYCVQCTGILDQRQAYKEHERNEQTAAVLLALVQTLKERGLLNDASQAIHKAGVGGALQALAERSLALGARTDEQQ